MNTKICTRCKETKDLSLFSWRSEKNNKKHSHCKDCHTKIRLNYYQNNKDKEKKRIKERKKELIKSFKDLKNTLECVICGENTPQCLDFHHNDPNEKDFNLAQAPYSGMSLDSIKKEIEKCTVLCANCHRKRHAGLV